MKIPRDLSGQDLSRALTELGYRVVRRRGSHMRLETELNGGHNVTVPDHAVLKIGTLSSILRDVGAHARLSREELVNLLFD